MVPDTPVPPAAPPEATPVPTEATPAPLARAGWLARWGLLFPAGFWAGLSAMLAIGAPVPGLLGVVNALAGGGLGGLIAAVWLPALVRPEQPETRVGRRRRRLRLMVRAPLMAAAGMIAGALPTGVYVEGVGFPFVLAGAGAVGAWLVGHVDSRLRRRRGSDTLKNVLSLLTDVALAAALFAPFGPEAAFVGGIVLPALFAVGDLFAGDTLHEAARAVSEGGGAQGPDYTGQEELARRGEVDRAVRDYEAQSRARDDHADPLLHAAWLLRDHGRLHEALDMLRRAVRTPRMDGRRASSITWQMAELAVRIGDPGLVVPDLQHLLKKWEKEHDVGWAKRQLEVLSEAAVSSDPPSRGARTPP